LFTTCMKNITPYQKELRLKWYALAEREKRTLKEVCWTFGIPKKTYYKWYRYDHGYGLNDYMPKKEHPATKLTRDLQSWIAERKRKTNYGPEKMAIEVKRVFALTVSSTIIYRPYLRKKLIRKPQKHNPWYEPLKEKLLITKAGEGVQIDVKYVWRDGQRHYQFSVFDPYIPSSTSSSSSRQKKARMRSLHWLPQNRISDSGSFRSSRITDLNSAENSMCIATQRIFRTTLSPRSRPGGTGRWGGSTAQWMKNII